MPKTNISTVTCSASVLAFRAYLRSDLIALQELEYSLRILGSIMSGAWFAVMYMYMYVRKAKEHFE